MATFVEPKVFAEVVRLTPLVSIDLILRDPQRRVLVGLRTNEPAKDTYFVPGGIILKNESLDEAFGRVLEKETGIVAKRSDARFLGVYEHMYDTNFYSGGEFGTHYLVLVHELEQQNPVNVRRDDQHRGFEWMSEAALLLHPDVHEITKNYFKKASVGSVR